MCSTENNHKKYVLPQWKIKLGTVAILENGGGKSLLVVSKHKK